MQFAEETKCDSCKNHSNCKHIKFKYDDNWEYNSMFNTLELLQNIKDEIIILSKNCQDYTYNDISNVGFKND
jgi:hypothetical protein